MQKSPVTHTLFRKNLLDMAGAAAAILRRDHYRRTTTEDTGEFIDDEIINERFGLNYDFIEQAGLTWIDNLETGSGKNLASPSHEDHFKSYVQDYIHRFGTRKVEANALVIQQDRGPPFHRLIIHPH